MISKRMLFIRYGLFPVQVKLEIEYYCSRFSITIVSMKRVERNYVKGYDVTLLTTSELVGAMEHDLGGQIL